MNIFHKTSLLLFFVFTILKCEATENDTLVNRIFKLAYNQEYTKAETLLLYHKSSIDEFYFAVLDIDMSYWKNVSGTETPTYEAFEKTLQKYDNETATTFNQKGIQLIRLSYQLRYEIKRFKIFAALSTQKQTGVIFDELKENKQLQHLENQDLFRLYTAMFSYFDNYLKPFSGKNGDKKCMQAINTMEELTSSEIVISRTLSSYFLSRIYMKYEKTSAKAIPHLKMLTRQYPDNKKFHSLLQSCLSKSKK